MPFTKHHFELGGRAVRCYTVKSPQDNTYKHVPRNNQIISSVNETGNNCKFGKKQIASINPLDTCTGTLGPKTDKVIRNSQKRMVLNVVTSVKPFIKPVMQQPQLNCIANLLSKKTSTFLLQNIRSTGEHPFCKPCGPCCCGGNDDGGNDTGEGSAGTGKALTMDNLNPNIIALEYAVRGPLVIRAGEIEKEIQKGAKKPFKHVIRANIGDAHAMGQRPVTFIRQVLACTIAPSLIKSGDFPKDVKARAEEILKNCGGNSVGSYTPSQGVESIRKNIAKYIAKRDAHPSNWEDVFLCGGASLGIRSVMSLFCNEIDGKKSGLMIPIPQYPLYSASIAEYGLAPVSYYLNEKENWALEVSELERSYEEGNKNCKVRAIVVINPGNPTGQVLSKENIENIIKFAHKYKLFIFADEVYQHNIYSKGSQFFSFKKVMSDMGEPYNKIEMASFMSASKCYMGECGIRGGWAELVNMDPEVQANLYKASSAKLCPSSLGQIVMDCVVRHPVSGDPSYELFEKERSAILNDLAQRAQMVYDTFNKMEGFTCNVVQGAMYAFPRINLPPKAIKAAEAQKKKPDAFYAFKLLEETGICIIPGSGFGQQPGTYHFRTTILPSTELLKVMLDIFQKFHTKFTKEFS